MVKPYILVFLSLLALLESLCQRCNVGLWRRRQCCRLYSGWRGRCSAIRPLSQYSSRSTAAEGWLCWQWFGLLNGGRWRCGGRSSRSIGQCFRCALHKGFGTGVIGYAAHAAAAAPFGQLDYWRWLRLTDVSPRRRLEAGHAGLRLRLRLWFVRHSGLNPSHGSIGWRRAVICACRCISCLFLQHTARWLGWSRSLGTFWGICGCWLSCWCCCSNGLSWVYGIPVDLF